VQPNLQLNGLRKPTKKAKLKRFEMISSVRFLTLSGGDWHLVADFVQAVSKKNPALLTSTMGQSIESHIACFRAERSWLEGRIIGDWGLKREKY
jgi:hypothetical protein